MGLASPDAIVTLGGALPMVAPKQSAATEPAPAEVPITTAPLSPPGKVRALDWSRPAPDARALRVGNWARCGLAWSA